MDIFVTILTEWAEIGVPPDDFDAIAMEQIESISTHAEQRVAAFVSLFDLSSGDVLRCVRELLPGLIAPYREENRFRYCALTAGTEMGAQSTLAYGSKPEEPQPEERAPSGRWAGHKRDDVDLLPELPLAFQHTFEAAKAKADLEYVTRHERFPNNPKLAELSIHRSKMIQDVFFAFCTQARSACREASWTATQVRQAVETAWPVICDSYFIREHGDRSNQAKAAFRAALWKTIENDQQWKRHLSELVALAARDSKQIPHLSAVPAPAAAPKPINGVGIHKRESQVTQFLKRASWLAERLRERSWNKHELWRRGGPDHKTT